MTRTIVLVHGAWVTPASWDRFRGRYEHRGYKVMAPPWPHEHRPIARLRASPARELGRIGVRQLVDHYASIVQTLSEPPILVGHSIGGLVVQLLADRGLGAAVVSISPAPPRGILPGLTALRANLPVVLAWGSWNRVLSMPFGRFASSFLNTTPVAERRAIYNEHVVPTPGRVFWDSLGRGTGLHWCNTARPPLLILSGTLDRAIGVGVHRRNMGRYRGAPSRTDFREFPGRSHWIIAERGWEEVADHALDWVEAL